MSEFTWTTNDFELSEYLTSNDNRMLPTAFTEGEIIREINSLEKKYAALKRENERLLDGIRNARHCLTHGRNTIPTEGERFDIGVTYTLLSKMLGD